MSLERNISYSLDDREAVKATLTISMTVREWRALVKQAADYRGNFYILTFKWAIDAILRDAEEKYIEFQDETKKSRVLLDGLTPVRLQENGEAK